VSGPNSSADYIAGTNYDTYDASNSAAAGDGGGIALAGFTGDDRVRLYNNMIVDNVAGLAGGGISIAGVPAGSGSPVVDIVHTTVAHNDSTATAGAAFASPLNSTPQPAGIAGRGPMDRVRIANSIVWRNRSFYYGECSDASPCGVYQDIVGNPAGSLFGEKVVRACTEDSNGQPGDASGCWDLGSLSGDPFNPLSSVLSAVSGPNSSADYIAGTNYDTYDASNSDAAPAFVAWYFNTDRRKAYIAGETNGEATLISTPAAFDEGGNFIRAQYGPLTLEDPNSTPANQLFGDYHLTAGVAGAALCGGGSTSLFGQANCNGNNNAPLSLLHDYDGDARPTTAPDRGADEVAP